MILPCLDHLIMHFIGARKVPESVTHGVHGLGPYENVFFVSSFSLFFVSSFLCFHHPRVFEGGDSPHLCALKWVKWVLLMTGVSRKSDGGDYQSRDSQNGVQSGLGSV